MGSGSLLRTRHRQQFSSGPRKLLDDPNSETRNSLI